KTATATKAASCTAVSAITTPGGTCEEVIFTPRASAGMSTTSAPTAASATPLSSAAGAVHGDHRACAAGSPTSLRHPVPGGELRAEERHRQRRDREHGALRPRSLGQPRSQPHGERKQHQQKARQR